MIKGIDLSYHNGTVDFKKVKEDGYEFVIIRAGFGQSGVDRNFVKNIKGAIKNGLKVGVYWFLYAKTKEQLNNNIKMADATLRNYKDNLTMGVWCDWEYDSDRYYPKLNNTERTNWVKTFIDGMNARGYECGLYANPDYIENKFNYKVANKPSLYKYPLWLAWYTDEDKIKKYNPIMWQKTSKGSVRGVKGLVDIDYYYGNTTANTGVTECEKGIVNTNNSNLNVRNGCSTKDSIVGKFKKGTVVDILARPNATWLFVSGVGIDGKKVSGYVSKKYIKEK